MSQSSVSSAGTARAARGAEVVRRLLHVSSAMRHQIRTAVGRLGLTPAVARALYQLDPDQPLPARNLAEQLSCDRSNVTGLVDKLEEAGLVERHADPADRRVKTLVVTEAGRRMRQHVHEVMTDSSLLDALDDAELDRLGELVAKVSDAGCPEDVGPPD